MKHIQKKQTIQHHNAQSSPKVLHKYMKQSIPLKVKIQEKIRIYILMITLKSLRNNYKFSMDTYIIIKDKETMKEMTVNNSKQ
jgi:hypothetical protein